MKIILNKSLSSTCATLDEVLTKISYGFASVKLNTGCLMLILHLSQNQSRCKHSVNTGYVLRGCSSVIVDYKNENGFPSS